MNVFSERIWATIDSSGDAYWRMDSHGNIVETSKSYCLMSGFEEEELLGMNISDLDIYEPKESAIAKAKQSKEQRFLSFRTVHARKNGSYFEVEVKLKYLAEHGGSFFAFIREFEENPKTEAGPTNQPKQTERYARLISELDEVLHPAKNHFSTPSEHQNGSKSRELELVEAIEKNRRSELVNKVCLYLLYYSKNHSPREVITEYLNQLEKLSNSAFSYCNILDSAAYNTTDFIWSDNALSKFSQNEISEATVLQSIHPNLKRCLQQKQPLIITCPPIQDDPQSGNETSDEPCYQLIIPAVLHDTKVESLVGLIRTGETFGTDDVSTIQFITEISTEILKRKLFEDRARKLQKATENTHVAIVITDKKGNIEHANPYFSTLTGYEKRDFHGKNPRILKSGLHSNDFYTSLWDTISSGKTWEGEIYNRKKDGTHYWESATISPIKNEKDEIVSYVAVKSDISDTKQIMEDLVKAKEQAEESKKWFEAIFETNPAPISITKLDGEYVAVNAQFSKITGFTKAELIGNRSIDISIWDDLEVRKKLIHEIKTKGFIKDLEASFNLKDGTKRHTVLSAQLVNFGKEPNILLVTQDVTRQKEAEIQLIATKDKAEESDRLKTAFLHNISHEIRTPMNAIIGFSELLTDVYEDKETMQQYIRIINQRCHDLLIIINSILDISSIECGQVAVYNETFSLGELYRELLELSFEQQLRMNKQHIPVQIAEQICGMEQTITTDLGKLKQIFINLINNALKYSNKGVITLGHQLIGKDRLRFYVSDTGIGIKQDDFGKLFVRFKQLEHNSSDHFGGNGLGLAICKGLVEALGGEIGVTSKLGEGSTFHFTINLNSNSQLNS